MAFLNNCWYHFFIDSASKYAACGAPPSLNFIPKLNAFTCQLWVYGTTGSGTRTLVSRADSANQQYLLETNINGNFITAVVGGTSQTWDITGLSLGSGVDWHQVVLRVTTAAARVYIDGVFIAPEMALVGQELAAVDTLICARRDISNTDFVNLGHWSVDEVCFWNVALTDAEILALYGAGIPLDPTQDSGSYLSSAELLAFWRMGDGDTEYPNGPATALVADMSGHGLTATLYTGAIIDPAPEYTHHFVVAWLPYCDDAVFESSSSAFIPVEPVLGARFVVTRGDQGVTEFRQGHEGSLLRLHLDCEAFGRYVDPNVFVIEYGRPVPGTSMRREVFRRVATLTEMLSLGVGRENAQTQLPHAFRTSIADLFGSTQAQLDAAWVEVQRQCAILALDMNEMGRPVGGELRGGGGELLNPDDETFGLQEIEESSSSAAAEAPGESSSSSAAAAEQGPGSSSSSVSQAAQSSSSLYVDPNLFSETIYLAAPSDGDAATRFDDDGTKTLYTDLGFVRFGRNAHPLNTWDAFLRFPMSIPQCAEIISATLRMTARTSESGFDVVVRIKDAYQNAAGYQAVGSFSGTTDPKTARNVVWDRVGSLLAGQSFAAPDITDLLQFFVDRQEYTPGTDYFALWLSEVTSDPGARRDATLEADTPYLNVVYRTDRECYSSSLIP